MSRHPVTLKTKFSYGIGALGKDFAVSIIYIYLMFYYTDVVGISAAFVGTLFLVARVIDAITDPMMGMIVDNTRTRFGKFRPWIVIGTLVNSVFLLMVFSSHNFAGNSLYVYAAITYILWGVSYTIMDIPYWSMFPALSDEREERERLVVWPRLFAATAWMIMGYYGLQAVENLDSENLGNGFFVLCILIVGFFIFSAVVTAVNVKEQVKTAETAVKFTLKDVIRIIKSNDQLQALFGSVLTFNIAIQLVGGLAIYYFTYAIGSKELFPYFMLASGIAEMSGIFLFPFIARSLPRRFIWIIACGFPIVSCAVLLGAGILAPTNIILVATAGAALKFGHGLANGLSTVMLADVVDYGEHRTGNRSESIIFSIQTMLVKAAGALAGFFIGIGLSLVGYIPNIEQPEDTVMGIRLLMIIIPVFLMIFSAMIYRAFYKLHEGFDREAFLTECA